jgi:hypothetical protein
MFKRQKLALLLHKFKYSHNTGPNGEEAIKPVVESGIR